MSNAFDPDYKKQEGSNPSLQLTAILDPHESLLWHGRPIASRVMFLTFAIYLFAIPWLAISLFWQYMALQPLLHQKDFVMLDSGIIVTIGFPLFGLFFILIGLILLFSPFIAYLRAKKTIYAITTKRTLVLCDGGKPPVDSLFYDELTIHLSSRVWRDGTGTLSFSVNREVSNTMPLKSKVKNFEQIKDVVAVKKILIDALSRHRAYNTLSTSDTHS